MRDQPVIRRLLSGILLLVLVCEWMRPLTALSGWTDVYSIIPIMITISGILAVDVLNIHPIWTWIVKLFIIVSAVAAMFQGVHLLPPEWRSEFAMQILGDLLNIVMGDWNSVSGEARTLLFVGAWSTVVSWLYAVILYQRIALYVMMVTVVYLLSLQTLLDLNTTRGVIITVIAGLILHGLSVLPSLERTFGLKSKQLGWPLRWVASSMLLVSVTVGCGLLLSMGQDKVNLKLPASLINWNWQSLAVFSFPSNTNTQTDPMQKSGYSLTDSTLGGSVKSDDSVAFLANTERPDAYWRGESKTVYDGKSWTGLANDLYGYEVGDQLPDVLIDMNTAASPNSSTIIQEVFPLPDYPSSENTTILLASGAIRSVEQIDVENDSLANVNKNQNKGITGIITVDRIEGKFTLQGSAPEALLSYRVQSSKPLNSEGARMILAADKWVATAPIPQEITIPNLQLPEQLPKRVSQLAHSITAELDSAWEKASAIEQYLNRQYRYTLTPKPPAMKGDFVDQFLFEQLEGYCDYFSTAMVIMLRSVGVPARWVKGYAPGEIIAAEENEFLQESAERLRSSQVKAYPVMVRNRDAHSWVEVYIAGVGWTSFDPTPASLAVSAQVDGISTASSEEISNHPVKQALSQVMDKLTDSRFQAAFIVLATITVIVHASRRLIRSDFISNMWRTLLIRLLLLQYAWGIAKVQADTRLLERVLALTFKRYGHDIHEGETLRESVGRGYFPYMVKSTLLELVSLYEEARYSPRERKRIPYTSIIASWRMLR